MGEPRGVLGGGHAVHVTQECEGVGERQVPPELRALTEHDADAAREGDALGHRLEPAHAHAPRGGIEHAGEHLERGGLARAVGADVAERLSPLHGEVDAVDGVDEPRPAAQPARPDAHRELLPEAGRLDDGHEPALR